MSKFKVLLLAMALVGSVAVEAAPPGFALTGQTAHFSFYARDNQKVDAKRVEDYLVRIESLLGKRVSGRAEYYRYSWPEQIAVATGTRAAGMTFPQTGQIHSTQEFHPHEIVHLVAGQLGSPGAFFQEGLAVAIGDEAKWNGASVNAIAKRLAKDGSLVSVSDMVSRFDGINPEIGYPVAGSFVAFLVKTHGMASVVEFFRACPRGGSTEVAFEGAFGQSLTSAGAAWMASL